MYKPDIENIMNNIKEYLSIFTADDIRKAKYSVIVNGAKFRESLGLISLEIKEEYRIKARNCIIKTIKKMKEVGVPIRVDNEIFAIGYPYTYKLVKIYYDTLYDVCLKNDKIFNPEKGLTFDERFVSEKELKKKIDFMRHSTYTLFTNELRDKSIDELNKETGLSEEAIVKIKSKNVSLNISTSYVENDVKAAKYLYELIINGSTIEEASNKCNVSYNYASRVLEIYLTEEEYSLVKDKLKNNSVRLYQHLNSILSIFIKGIMSGIDLPNGEKEKFTMLDYYSLTGLSFSSFVRYLKDLEIKSDDAKVMYGIVTVSDYIVANNNLGRIVNRNNASYDNLRITNDSGTFYLKDYVDDILQLFRDNNIPPYKKLVDLAFQRLVKGIPILPLKNNDSMQKHSSI